MAVMQRCLIKLRFRLVVDDSNWPLLTGGRYSQVAVKSGLTVLLIKNFNNEMTLLIQEAVSIGRGPCESVALNPS